MFIGENTNLIHLCSAARTSLDAFTLRQSALPNRDKVFGLPIYKHVTSNEVMYAKNKAKYEALSTKY